MKVTKKIKQIAEKHEDEILCKSGVVGVGVGVKKKKGKALKKEAIVCLVQKKKPASELSADDLIPAMIDGKPTDVIEVGEVKALHRARRRPLVPGVSSGHHSITAGTLGLFVKKGDKVYALSNNHVFANSNAAFIGDAIYQPGPLDGGRANDTVANLAQFVPILFDGSNNTVDAAVALVVGEGEPPAPGPDDPVPPPPKKQWWIVRVIRNAIDYIVSLFRRFRNRSTATASAAAVGYSNNMLNFPGALTGDVAEVNPGDAVRKSGRTTGYTTGTVTAVGVTVNVDFGSFGIARFRDQILIEPGNFSAGGDSGSAIFDEDGNWVGLLFAGSATTTFANRASLVQQALGVDEIL